MLPEVNLAFDTRLYAGVPQAEKRLASDLAALALETAPQSDRRITPYSFVQTPNGQIICPEFAEGKDILETLRWETPSDILESKATLAIRDFILLQEEAPFIIVWISPPDTQLGYPEARMVVGIGSKKGELKAVQNYGICLDFSLKTCLSLAESLSGFSKNKKSLKINSADQLRATPIFLKSPPGEEPEDFIAQLIPLPDVWKKIRGDEAKALKEQALKDARAIARKKMPQMKKGLSQEDYLIIGAQIEQEMISAGWPMRNNSGCGMLNTEILSSNVFAFGYSYLRLNNQGEIIHKKSEAGVFVKKCPFCGRSINKVIQPGYKCACGQTYLGVC